MSRMTDPTKGRNTRAMRVKTPRQGKFLDPEKFKALAHELLAKGAVWNGATVQSRIKAGCQRPAVRVFYSTLDRSTAVGALLHTARYIEMDVPCRSCPPCLRRRAAEWRTRALIEIGASRRTWFGTFTVAPEYRFRWAYKSIGSLPQELTEEQFKTLWSLMSAELTKYFKRLRKAGYTVRYLLVAEHHKDGFPHAHALIHEPDGAVTKRALQAEWPFGFTNFKLVEDTAVAGYATKYLMKEASARVRASLRYGTLSSIGSVTKQGAVKTTPLPTTRGTPRKGGLF